MSTKGGPQSKITKPRKPNPNVVSKATKAKSQHAQKSKQQPKQQPKQQTSQKSGKMFGAVGGYKGVDVGTAKQMVNASVRPAIKTMLRDRNMIHTQAADAMMDASNLFDRSVGDLNHIFGAADQKVAGFGNQINTGYDQTMQQVAGVDAAGGQQIADTNSATQQAIMAELNRLGLGGNMGVSQEVMADGAHAQNVSTQMGSNNQSNLQMGQQSAQTVTSLLGGMLAGSKASNMGQALNTRNDDIADVGRAKRDDLSTLMGSINEMRASKPMMIRDMLMQLQAQGFDQWQAIQALNMDRRSLNHSMAMDRAGMAEDGSYYGTLASAFGNQAMAGAPGASGIPNSIAPNGKPQPVVPGSYVGGKKPKKGSKTRAGSGSRADDIRGPLAGGYS